MNICVSPGVVCRNSVDVTGHHTTLKVIAAMPSLDLNDLCIW